MAIFQALLIFAAFSSNFFEQIEAQRISNVVSAPFFDEGENLSFRNCGKWNKSVRPYYPPWFGRIKLNSSYMTGTVISRRTTLLDIGLCDHDERKIRNGEMKVEIGKCREQFNCTVDKNEGFVVKVLDFVEYSGVTNLTLLITEKMPEFNDYYSPICLFNRGNELDFQQKRANSYYEIFSNEWLFPKQVKNEPIERCLNNETITGLQNVEPSELHRLICIFKPDDADLKHLIYNDDGRYFLRGRRADLFNVTHGSNDATHDLFYDFVPLTHWIAHNSPDISILPEIPTELPIKKFKSVQNLSFQNCGIKGRIQSRQKRDDDEDEDDEPGVFIHGGTNAISGNHPWHAEIQISETSDSCGGTLISKRAVLTAAHCLVNLRASEFEVTLGIHDLHFRNGGQTKVPSKLIIHENYTAQTYENDLGLMIFDQAFQLNERVSPICLWNEDFALDRITGKYAMAVGWGLDENFRQPNYLQEAQLPIKSYKECYLEKRTFFGKHLKPGKNFCAGYTNGTTVCNGDSGAGLSIEKDGRWFIRGIVSFGRSQKRFNEYGEEEKVCHPNSYSVFTDVGGFMDWIVKNTPDISYLKYRRHRA